MVRWVIVAAALSALACAPASAQYGFGYGGLIYVQQGGQRGDTGERPSRSRREQADRRQGDRERRNTMTPDERQELNRDLQRANREIYRKGRDQR